MSQQPSVKFSRAGDMFHYRWAARRCMRLIDPQFGLESITVEGSKEPAGPGEYVIDLSEYSLRSGQPSVEHFQLKHSTVRTKSEFTLTELRKTLEGFAARYTATATDKRRQGKRPIPTFTFVSNRSVSGSLKKDVKAIASGKGAPSARKLAQMTGLSASALQDFCRRLSFPGREGDYRVQKRKLQGTMSEYLAGFVDGDDADLLVALVADRVMPESENGKSDGEILPEDVLQKLGVTSRRELFPAPALFEKLVQPIQREQQAEIVRHILSPAPPSIIHAIGGVGKTVVARLVASSLPRGSRAVIYDCFGSGKYLSPSEPRHRARDALVQMANELAAQGLCPKLIPRRGLAADDYIRSFIDRLETAVAKLRETTPGALLVLLVDAADNAKMAANERGEDCFASDLLRVALPRNCRLAMFARTERVDLLVPPAAVRRFALATFSLTESLLHLRRAFPQATSQEGHEFHRLSAGNPRVQANALEAGLPDIAAVLANLGPHITTLNSQIAGQLQAAMDNVKARHSAATVEQVDAICYGLANLPPLIPISVLAKAAGVSPDAVKSFVADLGRPLWHSDDAVQFRDEPTETWFREQFAADDNRVKEYTARLAPLAEQFPYIAKALPQLLLRMGEHSQLVALALSDRHLPTNNAIEERNVRVYRLQFAFKAALKLGHLADAAQLALRAGEEVAGDQRQTELLSRNLDLVAVFEEQNRVQEMAYRHLLGGGWPGCENIYSAALLSSFSDFHGEAQAFLRSGRRWLQLYFEDREKQAKKRPKSEPFHEPEKLTHDHLIELWWAHYNLLGAKGLVAYAKTWRPFDLPLEVMSVIFHRLIDAGRFGAVDELALVGAGSPYFVLAAANELIAVGRLPPASSLGPTLQFLADPKKRPDKPERTMLDDPWSPALVSFLEACGGSGLPRKAILQVLDHYQDTRPVAILGTEHQEGGRRLFMRRASLRAWLRQEAEPTIPVLFPPPKEIRPGDSRDRDEENRDQMLGALLPWHFTRTGLILGHPASRRVDLKALQERASRGTHMRFREFDRLPSEMNAVRFEVLAWNRDARAIELNTFKAEVIDQEPKNLWLSERLLAARIAFRLPHLKRLRAPLEHSCRSILEPKTTEAPEERAKWYIALGRAVFAESKEDAAAYFGQAVDAVSKFGDEMVARWEALVTLANRSAEPGQTSAETVYRFVRCAETVGDTVAREKYWDRDDVFRTVLRLEPAAAFAALSRWRDRAVGWFSGQIEALAIASVTEQKANATATWCLSGFAGCNESQAFAEACLRAETIPARRIQLFERIVRDFELADLSSESWTKLAQVATELGLPTTKLATLAQAPTGKPRLGNDTRRTEKFTRGRKIEETKRWKSILRRVDVMKPSEIGRVLLLADQGPRDPAVLWRELMRRVPRGQERRFLRLVAACPELDYFDAGYATRDAQEHWLGQSAVRQEWPNYLQTLGRRFAAAFTRLGSLRYWQREQRLGAAEVLEIRKGMLTGLADSLDLATADTFFGFVANIAADLSHGEARTLLAYALDRFERHIDLKTYADGPFQSWLVGPTDLAAGMAGLVWAALASPYAATRWEAAHCVRRWAELGCDREIDALLDWLRRADGGAFVGWKLPFYGLHARLYLLWALARVAVDGAGTLVRHAPLFADLALNGMPHYLIQSSAAQIALLLEQAHAGTYPVAIVAQLPQVGVSTLPPRITGDRAERVDSPRHASSEVDRTLKFHFGMDFGDYWLDRLGDAFGVPQQQIEELAREVIVKEFGEPSSDQYRPDPRLSQWDRWERGTGVYKSSYPKTDDHQFYLSYHAMHSVAGQLLKVMPTVIHSDRSWWEDEWDNWTRMHRLTRSDGRWLSDRRDPDPHLRRPWVHAGHDPQWLWGVAADDFQEIIYREAPLADSLCIDGDWTDCVQSRVESIRVDSALVDPRTASALADSLRHARRARDFRLPPYGDERAEESGSRPFDLKGWVLQPDGEDSKIDSFDPYAKEIRYPPLRIGDTFAKLLSVASDPEARAWRKHATGPVLALTEIWSNRPEREPHRREEPFRSGQRMTAAVALLRELCAATQRDLIISVKIDRRWDASYKPALSEYIPDSHKVFIFSADGRLKDSKRTYRVG